MAEFIKVSEIDGAVIIRFARPETRNSLSAAVLDAIGRRIERCDDRLIIFTGAGEYFASGADLREVAATGADSAREFATRGQRLMAEIAGRRTVAAINGACFGGGLDLSLACQKRFAHPRATFCHPGARLGIMTGWGGTQRLPRLIGEAAALEMFLTAEPINSQKALAIGLIDGIDDDPVRLALKENL